jgi:hypothetical protein|tara:strand:- start:144 stop:635 length:492 start_codon:yes stop_codon:yes gene_type:complete
MSTTRTNTITTTGNTPNRGKVVRTNSNGITRLVNAPINNGRTPNRNTMRKLALKATTNRINISDLQQQLVSTYLSFAYEMKPGLERKIFKKYILLIMHSIDKIARSSTNLDRYSRLYEEAENLTGTVDIKVQNSSAEIISGIIGNITKIDSSTSKKLTKLLIF